MSLVVHDIRSVCTEEDLKHDDTLEPSIRPGRSTTLRPEEEQLLVLAPELCLRTSFGIEGLCGATVC